MASSTKTCGTGTQYDNSGGIAWSNTGYIVSDGGGSASVTLALHEKSDFLVAYNFGFSIPTDATITAVTVYCDEITAIISHSVKLVKDATQSSGGTTSWTVTGSTDSLGGDISSSWNAASWTPADFNSSNFGVFIWFEDNSFLAGQTYSIDYVSILITYTEGGSSRVQFIGI